MLIFLLFFFPINVHSHTQSPWPLRLPGYAPISLLSDCRHGTMNIGKQHVRLCVGFHMGALTPKQLDLEVARGVYQREELSGRPPWQMDPATVAAAQRLVRSLKVPGWKGGKLPKIYAARGLRFVKMDHWRKYICGDHSLFRVNHLQQVVF
jgi:hypothetical protein